MNRSTIISVVATVGVLATLAVAINPGPTRQKQMVATPPLYIYDDGGSFLFYLDCGDAGGCSIASGSGGGGGTGGGGSATPPAVMFAVNGLGMGTACSGVNPTLADGGPLTYPARAGARTCYKHDEFDNVAVGDMVFLSANQRAVQGTTDGGLGLSNWNGATNYLLGSEALDNTSLWTRFGTGAAAPTVTADYALAPQNTMVAERIQIPATASGQESFIYNTSPCSGLGYDSMSCYARAVSTTCDTQIAWGGGSGGWDYSTYTLHSSYFTRIYMTGSTVANASLLAIGNFTENMNACDMVVTDCQCEYGPLVSPYIPTTVGATATRASEPAPYVTMAGSALYSMSAVFNTRSYSGDVIGPTLSFAPGYEIGLSTLGAKGFCSYVLDGGISFNYAPHNLLDPSVEVQLGCAYGSGVTTACQGDLCKQAAEVLSYNTGTVTVRIGGFSDGGAANAVVKDVLVDNTSTTLAIPNTSVLRVPGDDGGYSAKVAGTGNSIAVGGFDIKLDNVMDDELAACFESNDQYAVSGTTIAQAHTAYTTSIKGHPYRAVWTNAGVNNLIGALDADAGWVEMESFLDDVTKDGGYHMILGNVTGCQGYSGCQTATIQQFNAHEVRWCADAGYRATCIDNFTSLKQATTIQVVATGAGKLGTECIPTSDSLHPNNYCSTLLGVNYYNGIRDAGL